MDIIFRKILLTIISLFSFRQIDGVNARQGGTDIMD